MRNPQCKRVISILFIWFDAFINKIDPITVNERQSGNVERNQITERDLSHTHTHTNRARSDRNGSH